MISFNLISVEQKKYVTKIKVWELLKHLGTIIIIFSIITAAVIFFAYQLLLNNEGLIDDQLEKEKQATELGKATAVDEAIISLNNQLTLAKSMQDNHVKWPVFLSKLIESSPDGIVFESLQFNTATLSFRITGTASNRDILLNYQESLKNFKYFDSVTFPISSLAQKDLSNFEITGKLTNLIYAQ
jgi:Tfp pilus assembly protein PilN